MGKNNAAIYDKVLADTLKMTIKSKKVNDNTVLKYASSASKKEFAQIIRILDEQDAVNRYRWYNLPDGITSQELERMLYYKGQLAFFYYDVLKKFYVTPYALDGTIDFYGRYNTIKPVPFSSGQDKKDEESKKYDQQAGLLSLLRLNVVYDVLLEEELTEDILKNSAVLIHDYTKQLPPNIIPRSILNERFVETMSDILPYMETALLVGCGVKGYRVQSADEAGEVTSLSTAMYGSALNKLPYAAIIGNVDFQELGDGGTYTVQDYLMSLQSLDNFRLSTYGIANGGFFEKKAHALEAEQAMNSSQSYNAFQDGLSIRQEFCNRVNALWDLGIWCEPSESVLNIDLNGDGAAYDEIPSIYETGETAPEGGTSDVE